jgi:hypothetical protein
MDKGINQGEGPRLAREKKGKIDSKKTHPRSSDKKRRQASR